MPYFWRVASVNDKGDAGPWSRTLSFVGAADAPILKATRVAGNLPLEIDTSSAQSHQVQIARDASFTNIVSDRTIVGNKFDVDKLSANAYYIRVRGIAVGEQIAGVWSEPRMLEVYPLGGGWWLSESPAPIHAPASR